MKKGNFYLVKNEYCTKYQKYGVMCNKNDSYEESLHNRPCYYAFPDEEVPNIYWMIPISSKTQKYEKLLQKKLEKYEDYDGLEFGYVRGRKAAFLIQNICPVTKEYIVEEYIDCNTGKPVDIPNDLKRKLNAKIRKCIRFAKRGTLITKTDIIAILNDLIN